jgi:type II secretory pathway pseudopilin PulG
MKTNMNKKLEVRSEKLETNVLIHDQCSLIIKRQRRAAGTVTCNLSPVTSSRQRRAAFSLAEILIAIFVLSIGLIMIAAVFPVAAKWTAQDAQTSIAQVIAKNAVAQIQAQYAAGTLPAGVLNSPTAVQPFAGFGPFAYQFGTAQPYPFGTNQSYSSSANFAPYPLDPAPALPTPVPIPPPGSYYWSAVIVPAASGYAGVSPASAQLNNVYTVYVFVFNKGEGTNIFNAPAYGSPTAGNTLIPMVPYPQNSVASHLSFYPQLFEGEYQFAAPNMPMDSLGVDVSTGSVFRLITDPATNAVVPTGLAGGSVINTTSDFVIFAPAAVGQTASPLIYVYVTTVNL